ncbi:hypothetical protein V2J09_007150 [Rumex salicifolius]
MFHLLLLLLLLSSTSASSRHRDSHCPINKNPTRTIAAVLDLRSRMGKEQAIAMKIAIRDINRLTCTNLTLHVSDSHRNSGQAILAALQLIDANKVLAVVGSIPMQEVALISAIYETKSKRPIISLLPSAVPTPSIQQTLPNFIQMSNDITTQIGCIAEIVGQFQWRRITVIYEQNNGLAFDPGVTTLLSDALQQSGAALEHHLGIPSISSLSNPETHMTEELETCRNKSSRVFVVMYSSFEFATLLFKKAEELGMMEKGYVWIISDHVASFLNSFSQPTIDSMQGVIGFKTDFNETNKSFRAFNFKFQQSYGSMYPDEDEEPNPSFHALRAYDAVWAISKSQNSLSGSSFIGLGGNVSFSNGKLSKTPPFSIINVVGRSYNEIAVWSPGTGFTRKQPTKLETITKLGPIFWPGGEEMIPRGWNVSNGDKAMKIGIPAAGACPQFVKYSNNHSSGLAVDVFGKALEYLPYHLNYEIVPFYGTYDEMMLKIHSKDLDGAIGDINILSDRCQYAEFAHPYMRSSMVMVVPAKSERTKKAWMFMDVFETKMWFIIPAMSLFIGTAVFIIEHETQLSDRSIPQLIGDVLWFSLNLVFLGERDSVKRNLSRIILAPWLFLILMVATMYSASLTSIFTVSRLLPSVDSIETLKIENAVVGCNENSFIRKYVIEKLHYKPEKIKTMKLLDDYAEAFDKGELKAAFLISPQADIFIAKYCNRFVIAGHKWKFGGLGFAFSKGNRLVEDMSEAILKATESGEVDQMEIGMLASFNCSAANVDDDKSRLGFAPFSGLIYICCAVTSVMLISSLISRFVRRYCTLPISLDHLTVIIERFRWVSLTFIRPQ